MSMVNADSVQLFAMLKKMQDSISSIETTKKSVKMKYEQLGAGWQDKKYNELGVVVRDCNKALNDILQLKEIDDETEEYVGVENEFVLETVFALFKERNKDFFTFE